MATTVETSASSATEATKLPEAGSKVSKVATVSPAKGAWSQIVRGAHSTVDCDTNGTSSAASSSPPSSTSDAKKAAVPCSSMDSPLKVPSPNPASNEQSGSSQIAPQEGPEGSAKPAKQAWKRPNGNTGKTAPAGPVMGAVSWPALGDATGQKAQSGAEGQPDQLPASAPVIADPTPNATSNRQKGTGKKAVVPPVSSSGSDVNTAVGERSPKHNGDSGKPSNAGGGGGTDRGRVLNQQGAGAPYGHPGHRRNTREQGRPNHGWHAQRNFNYGRDNFPGIQTRFGPRHFPPPASTYTNMNPGFINAAGPPTGMYYIPVPSGGPVHGAGYFAAPGMLVPVPDHASLKQMLAKQIEYYFSVENLCRDIFLRSNMDHQGYIPVTVIAAFNRVRSLTTDTNMILDALRNSTVVEVQGDRIRKRNDWMNWLLPTESRNAPVQQSDTKLSPEGSRTEEQDGAVNSEVLFNEEHGSDNQVPEDSSKESVGIRLRNGHTQESAKNRSKEKAGGLTTAFGSIARGISVINEEPTFDLDEELHPHRDVQSHDDGDEDDSDVKDRDVQRLIIVTQRGSSRGDCKVSEKGHWQKGIPDDLANVINDGLYYYEQELHHGTQSSTGWERKQSKGDESGVDFSTVSSSYVESANSNGAEANGPVRPPKTHNKVGFGIRPGHQQRLFHSAPRDVNHRARHFIAESPPSDSIGFFFGAAPPEGQSSGVTSMGAVAKLSSSPSTASPGSTSFLGSPPVGSIPKSFPRFQHPSHALLEDNGFKQQKYVKFYNRCLADRKRSGIGCSEEMNSLFRFWCYFLRTNFNRAMYKDFRRLAEEESQAGFNYGMECLFRFYSYGLEQKFKQDLYEDFEHLTLETYKKGNLYGLEKYWAFHYYRKGKNNQPLKKHPELERLLNDEFRSLEDFQKVKERQHKDGLINGNGSLDSADLHLATSRPPSMTPASTTSASIAVS